MPLPINEDDSVCPRDSKDRDLPNKQPIKIGDRVRWISCSMSMYGLKDIECNGFVEKIKESTFGSSRKGEGATILVSTDEYVKFYKKRRAFVSLSKLTLCL
jgi:hypothetical protein